MRSTLEISVVAVMTATCVATNYLLVGVVNVKVMDLIVFVCGVSFGAVVGSSVGALTWLVYGTINPYGFSLPVLVSTCLGETIYGLAGGGLRRLGFDSSDRVKARLAGGIKFALIGFLLTTVYDLLTNLASALSLGLPILPVMVAGIPFAAVHEVSNAAFFFVGVVPLVAVMRRIQLDQNQVFRK